MHLHKALLKFWWINFIFLDNRSCCRNVFPDIRALPLNFLKKISMWKKKLRKKRKDKQTRVQEDSHFICDKSDVQTKIVFTNSIFQFLCRSIYWKHLIDLISQSMFKQTSHKWQCWNWHLTFIRVQDKKEEACSWGRDDEIDNPISAMWSFSFVCSSPIFPSILFFGMCTWKLHNRDP